MAIAISLTKSFQLHIFFRKTKSMIMMSIKSSAYIVPQFVVPGSGVQYSNIEKMYWLIFVKHFKAIAWNFKTPFVETCHILGSIFVPIGRQRPVKWLLLCLFCIFSWERGYYQWASEDYICPILVIA